MLTVDGQNGHMMTQGGGGDDATGHHHGLLVGESYRFPLLDGTQRGPQTSETHDGCQHHVDALHLHKVNHRRHASENLYSLGLEGFLHRWVFLLVSDDHGVGFKRQSLLHQKVGIAAGTEHLDSEEVTVTAYHVQCLRPY